jgi:uncharacterized protein
MVGQPYEITHQGRTYHGNVALVDYHVVERDGAFTLFRVADLVVTPITPALAATLARLIPGSGQLISDAFMQVLRAHGLVPPADPPAAPVADASTPPAPSPRRYPVVNIALFLTQTCNMRCLYCYGQGGEYGQPGVMTGETAHAAVDWLMVNSLDAEQVHIGFFGGEPLLNFPVLQQVVAYAKAQAAAHGKRITFGITTNASLLTDRIIAYLKAENINPLISFDGPPEIQNRQRPFKTGRGSYRQVQARIRKLRQAFPQLIARATVYGDADPAAIRQGLAAAGFTIHLLERASPVILAGGGTRHSADNEDPAAARMLEDQRAQVAAMFAAIEARTLDLQPPPVVLSLLAGLVKGHQRHVVCGVGRDIAGVSIQGDLYPCHRFVGQEARRLGHLHDYQAGSINDYHRAVVDNLPVCRGCWARYLCGGGCFYNHQAHTGDMHRPDPDYCREQQTVSEDLIHGWGQLDAAAQAYVRKQITNVDPEHQS